MMEWIPPLVPAFLAVPMTWRIVRDQREGGAASRGLFRFERAVNPVGYLLLTAANLLLAAFLWLIAIVFIDPALWYSISN
jgi:hypothetical protein